MAINFKFAAVAGAVLTVVLAAAGPASAQYYPGYAYRGPVYRTMPVRPIMPPPTYRVPYDRPYVQPYPTRPTFPVPPADNRIDQRGGSGSGFPSRPGVTPTCRSTRSNGLCFGGQRPGVY
jgi:hypothetical protein